MLRLAETIILAQGWNKHLSALVSGACGALALAPVSYTHLDVDKRQVLK